MINKLRELRALIVDGISMVSNLQLLYIHLRLVEIFGCSDNIPFAGISGVACCDSLQLVTYGKIYVISFKIAEVILQKGDSQLIGLLNKVRIASLNETDEQLLKSRFVVSADINYPSEALHIFAENKPSHSHNLYMLTRNESIPYCIPTIDELPKNIQTTVITKALIRNQSETDCLAGLLNIKLNARVMLTVNIDIEDRLINGQIANLKHILTDRGFVVKIYILMDDSSVGLKKRNSDAFTRQNLWIPVKKAEASIRLRANKESSSVKKRTQFPLMLSRACTVHKVQGLSLEKAVISFDLLKQRSFNYGQMYVALSRVTSLNGHYLTGEYKSSANKANPRAIHEYERMRDKSVIIPNANCGMLADNSLTITLLNVRLFPKHAIDISNSEMLLQTDIFCFTQTQLLLNR